MLVQETRLARLKVLVLGFSDFIPRLSTWCVSHLLNRCIVAVCDLQQVRNMMGTADKVVTVFNWSPTRQTVLEDHVQKINTVAKRTKRLELCRTRWIQRHDAFEAFKDFLPVLVDALEDYLQKETLPDTNTEASGLLHAITAFPFIMTLVTVQQCLGYIKSLSQVLQGRALDIVRAMDEVTTVADTLTKLRENIDPYSGELFTETNWPRPLMFSQLSQGSVEGNPRELTHQPQHQRSITNALL